MAYWWWRRRRRRPWRRRRRWRLRRPRRRRAPYRRRRGRRRVRKRRGRWRRTYRRWRRKRGRRKHRPKIILKQWQPNFTRNCFIVGYMPLIFCGENTVSQNYATHSDDLVAKGPYGGGMTTTKFTLRILFDEHLRWMNYWTVSNEDLDLCRYVGARFYFYRHPTVDFMVQIHTQAPFLDTELTGPSIHPGMMILNKRKIFVPSLKTRPNRKHKVRVKVGAPRLFEDKWYPQSELCDTTLVAIYATACDLQFPFGSPLTDNPCVNFQVLGSAYKQHLSILTTETEKNKTHYKEALFNKLAYYNTFQTIAHLRETGKQENANPQWNTCVNSNALQFDGSNQSTCNDTWYYGNAYTSSIQTLCEKTREKYFKATKSAFPAYATLVDDLYEYHGGIYSSIFLSAGRSYFETLGAYSDIIYNPFVDKGLGNIVWIDYLSKSDAVWRPPQSKCTIKDQPLWAAFNGYSEFCAKSTGDGAVNINCRVVVRCPYTTPMLIDNKNPEQGFVPYSKNFGNAKMKGGSADVPLSWRVKWYVMMYHQQELMEEIVQSGPWAYKGDEKSAALNMKYVFKWKWGGNPISGQVVRNPCKTSASSREPRSIQAVDPKRVAPPLVFHSWDYRRGYFGHASIKRMSEESEPPTLFTGPSGKRPRRDTNVQQAEEEQQKESSSFRLQRQLQPWINSSQETQSSQEEIQAQGSIQEQLLQQLGEQRALRKQLELLAGQVLKVQAGHHLHPLLSSQA
nr:MAG: ORF1 [Torque teno virus]